MDLKKKKKKNMTGLVDDLSLLVVFPSTRIRREEKKKLPISRYIINHFYLRLCPWIRARLLSDLLPRSRLWHLNDGRLNLRTNSRQFMALFLLLFFFFFFFTLWLPNTEVQRTAWWAEKWFNCLCAHLPKISHSVSDLLRVCRSLSGMISSGGTVC